MFSILFFAVARRLIVKPGSYKPAQTAMPMRQIQAWQRYNNMRLPVTLLFLLYSGFAVATDLEMSAQKEIAHLFDFLQNSNCQFGRNGSWFSPDKAVQHINKKYQYLLKRKAIRSAEDFIDRAATRSSTSGKPYVVKCNGAAVVESAVWFRTELDVLRKRNES